MSCHKTSRYLTGLMIIVLVLVAGSVVSAAEFKADVVITDGDKVNTLHIQVKNNSYRIEIAKEGTPMVMIRKRGTTYIIDHDNKQFRTLSPADENHFNPVAEWENLSYEMQGAYEATDTVGTYPCSRYAYSYKDSDETVFVRWLSKDLNFVIKQTRFEEEGEMTMELVNIELTPMDDALFAWPEDYKLLE